MLRIQLTASLFITLVSTISMACDCLPPPAPKDALKTCTAVFSGKVLDIEKEGDFHVRVTFSVQGSWKGVEKKTVEVQTFNHGASCGYEFTKGKTYLVYATALPGDKGLNTNSCSRTCAIGDAKADIMELGEGKAIAIEKD